MATMVVVKNSGNGGDEVSGNGGGYGKKYLIGDFFLQIYRNLQENPNWVFYFILFYLQLF